MFELLFFLWAIGCVPAFPFLLTTQEGPDLGYRISGYSELNFPGRIIFYGVLCSLGFIWVPMVLIYIAFCGLRSCTQAFIPRQTSKSQKILQQAECTIKEVDQLLEKIKV